MRGKTEVSLKHPIESRDDLSVVYTPGVGAVSADIGTHTELVWEYTGRGNTVAVVSDGSAVLGLGNLGPEAALPVMEGKCALFKRFANVDAVPIVLSVHEPDEIVAATIAIAPSFGGINLEDIAAPKCFEIEERLKQALSIPVMHDDQHGTAIVVLAGLWNALTVTGKKLEGVHIEVHGAGAAGVAIIRLLALAGARSMSAYDSKGVITKERADLTGEKAALLQSGIVGAEKSADVFIGVSRANTLTPEHIARMNKDPIIFALANPVPEIMPDVALRAGAAVVATGRSDWGNQINNVLAFPGIFRGAMDARLSRITDEMKVRAAAALAALVEKPNADLIIPDVFDERVVPAVAKAVRGS